MNQSINGVYHDSRFGNVTINQIGVSSTILERGSILVAGNLTIPNGRKFILVEDYHWADLTVNGNLDLSGTLEIAGGSGGSPWMNVTVNGEMNFPSTGWLDISFASFICNYTTTGSTTLSGKLTMDSASTFSYPNASVIIAPSFVQEISGGTLRFGKNLTAHGAGTFQLSSGWTEFVGSGTHYFGFHADNYLSNVKINKPSGTLMLTTNLKASSMVISDGTLDLGSYSCNITGTTDIYGTLAMTNAANDFTANVINWNSGSNDNVTAGTFHAGTWFFREGTTAKLGTGNTAYVTSTMYFPTSNDAEFGNLVRGPLSKNANGEEAGKAVYPTKVMGFYTVKSGTSLIFWESGAGMIVSGNATIENGASISFSSADFQVGGNLNLAGTLSASNQRSITVGGAVTFPSTGKLNLYNASFTCNYTSASTNLYGTLTMNNGSVFDYNYESLYFHSTFVGNISGGIIKCGPFFAQSAGTFQPTGGVVEIGTDNASAAAINLSNDNFFYDLVIIPIENEYGGIGGGRLQSDITIKSDLHIQPGGLDTNNYNINIEGNWINEGTFIPRSGKVTFSGGNYDQTCTNTTFNILEVDKPLGGLLNMDNTTVTCAEYDWTAGGISVTEGGTFTADDLADNGLFGTYSVTNGTMNLHQDTGQFVDLCGRIIVFPTGTLNIHGGADNSYWPYGGDAEITMSGGVLDFKDVGIHLYNLHTLTSNISGGTIRTAASFTGERADFQPTGGTVELYGSADTNVSQTDYTFFNLSINKAARNEESAFTSLRYDRTGKELPLKTRANTVELGSNLMVTNDLNVNAGTLDLNGYQLTAQNNVAINDGGILDINSGASLLLGSAKTLSVNNLGTLRVIGDEVSNAMISRIASASTYNLNVENGGTIAAQHAIFEYMRTNGVYVKSGAAVDPVYSFHHCTFRNGAAGGRLLRIENNQTIAINNAVFPENTWGGTYNVYKETDAGEVTFTDFSGDFSGSAYEYDPNNRIHWSMAPLPAPTNFTIQIIGGNIQLNWNAVVGATSYKVYSSDSPNGTFNPDLSGSFIGTTWTALIPVSPKFYRVTAVN